MNIQGLIIVIIKVMKFAFSVFILKLLFYNQITIDFTVLFLFSSSSFIFRLLESK